MDFWAIEQIFLKNSLWIVYVKYNLALTKLANNSSAEAVASDLEIILLQLTLQKVYQKLILMEKLLALNLLIIELNFQLI